MARFILGLSLGLVLAMGIAAFALPEDNTELARLKTANSELVQTLKAARDALQATRDALALCRDSQEGRPRRL